MAESNSFPESNRLTAQFSCETESQTAEQARQLAVCCPPGLVITLDGTLGAGKTFFTRAFAEGLQIDPETVSSPTYVIIQHYSGPERTIHHFDLYRLRDLDEWDELGADELLESEGISLIEWASRFPQVLPVDRLEIQIEVTGETARQLLLTAWGNEAATALRRWAVTNGSAVR